jgi:hypothetical protein
MNGRAGRERFTAALQDAKELLGTLSPDCASLYHGAIFISSLREGYDWTNVIGNGLNHLRQQELFMRLL